MTAVTAAPEKLVAVHQKKISQHSLVIFEFLTLGVLLALIFWSVRPLTEEWGLFLAFNKFGLGYIKAYAPSIPMRPFHLAAYALQWLLGNGHPVGVAAGTALLLVSRYLIARWAVSPLLIGHDRWIVATLAATIAFWPGAWLGRYGSAQLSAVFFFVALGTAIRLHQRFSVTRLLGCAISCVMMLATYQGLTLCLIALPFSSFLWRQTNNVGIVNQYSVVVKAVSVGIAVIVGFSIYGGYWLFISRVIGNAGYEGGLAGDSARLLTVTGLVTHIETAFSTAFTQLTYFLPLALSFVFLLCGPAVLALGTLKARVISLVLASALVVVLPVLSLVYVNAAHIRDLDRVLFPVSAGFIVVCLSLLSWFRSTSSPVVGRSYASAAVAILIVSSVMTALGARHYADIQEAVIKQTLDIAQKNNAKSVVIWDGTGVLGDVYTLFGPILTDASGVYGAQLSAVICTPLSVDRLHPVAQRFPIPSTPRCEELPVAAEGTLMLAAHWDGNEIVVMPQ